MTLPKWTKAEKHLHVVQHLRDDDGRSSIDYGRTYVDCFPSPEKKERKRRKYRGERQMLVLIDREEINKYRGVTTDLTTRTSDVTGNRAFSPTRDGSTKRHVTTDDFTERTPDFSTNNVLGMVEDLTESTMYDVTEDLPSLTEIMPKSPDKAEIFRLTPSFFLGKRFGATSRGEGDVGHRLKEKKEKVHVTTVADLPAVLRNLFERNTVKEETVTESREYDGISHDRLTEDGEEKVEESSLTGYTGHTPGGNLTTSVDNDDAFSPVSTVSVQVLKIYFLKLCCPLLCHGP